MSPGASTPIGQVVPGFPLSVRQPRQHPGGGLPGNSAVSVQVPHRVTRCLEFAKNCGYEVGSAVVEAVILISSYSTSTQNVRHLVMRNCIQASQLYNSLLVATKTISKGEKGECLYSVDSKESQIMSLLSG